MTKIFKNLEKIVKISIKLRVFSDRLFEYSHGGGGGAPGSDEEGGGVGNNGVGGGVATARWGEMGALVHNGRGEVKNGGVFGGVGGGGGQQCGGCLQPL